MQKQKHRGGFSSGANGKRREWEIAEHIRAGVPYREISRRFGVSDRTITNIKKRYGVKCTFKYRCSKSEKRVAIQLLKMGLSDVYIANLLGVRASCLFKY